MKRFSPSQYRVYQYVYLTLMGLWTAWLLRDQEGVKFMVGVVLLALIPVVMVVVEVQYRKQRRRAVSERADRPH